MESKKIISSPNLFYSNIKNFDVSDPTVKKFKDHMFQFFNGCSCNAEKNWDQALRIYKSFNTQQIQDIKMNLGVEYLDFYLDAEFLFRV